MAAAPATSSSKEDTDKAAAMAAVAATEAEAEEEPAGDVHGGAGIEAAAPSRPTSSPQGEEAAEPPPFSPEDLETYARDGFVHLREAFPPSVAAACREKVWGLVEAGGAIKRADPGTWPVKFPLAFIFEEGHGEVSRSVGRA